MLAANWLGEWNPQLVRELKGRLNWRNGAIAVANSVLGQLLLFLYYKNLLPTGEEQNRYCVGSPPPDWSGYQEDYLFIPNNFCLQDLLGHWMLLKNLWWLDLFVGMSIIGFLVLLAVGTYLLIADISLEERRGTLHFIRLSFQSASRIFIGKALGVPILLYLSLGLALPLHLGAGLAAGIPLTLILSFYGVVGASCAFFFSLAMLIGLLSPSRGGLQAFLGSVAVFWFLAFVTRLMVLNWSSYGPSVEWWLKLFSPGSILPYLVQSTFLPQRTVHYFDSKDLSQVLWYGQPLWQDLGRGIAFMLLNYGVWTYWLWQGIKRRFQNPTATVWSKSQSYWICGSFAVISVGFVAQSDKYYTLFDNFTGLLLLNLGLFLVLIASLSPHRQTLQDWARYRYQTQHHWWQDLVIGEKSPALVAIALNLAIITGYLLPSVLLLPVENRIPLLFGLLLSSSMILLYAVMTQLMLLLKTPRRSLLAAAAVGTALMVPIGCATIFEIAPNYTPELWLFSLLPVVATVYAKTSTILLALLGQWLVIALLGFQLTRQLHKAGRSDTKTLMSTGLKS